MKILKKRAGRYLEMPFFEYHLGRLTCDSIARLLQNAYKRRDKHEFNHLILAMSIITTHQCTDSCSLIRGENGYLSPGEIVPVEVSL